MAKLVSKTYGDALFDLAVQDNKVDALFNEATAVIEAFETNTELGKLLSHPKIERLEKEKVIENIFKKFVSDDMTGLLVLMVSKTRQNDIIPTLKYFVARVKEYKNVGTAYITTAIALTDEQKTSVVKRLLETTRYIEFEVNYSIDKSIIGGMIVRIGDRVVDSSIKTKLGELAKELKKIQLA